MGYTNYRKITDDLYYVGASDRRLQLFENLFEIPRGVSYNSYLLMDDKTVLFDTADKSVSAAFFANIKAVLDGRKLDYVIVNHMEPDHAAMLQEIAEKYPEAKIVGNAKTFPMIRQFFDFEFEPLTVAEGDTLETGHHTLTFTMAPMVHWPEVMMTFDTSTGILFSADAFGTFGAVDGNIFRDEIDFNSAWQSDARRYYTNIVGKYGAQVQSVLKKAANLDIKMICPLHGPIWRTNIDWLIEKYDLWSRWEPECDDVVIAYASMYGNTESAVGVAAAKLSDMGKRVRLVNICNTERSYAIAEMFRAKNIILAAPTYNGGIYPTMEALVLDMKALMLKNRNVGIIENGTWAPVAGKQITAILETMKDMNITGKFTVRSSYKNEQDEDMTAFCKALIGE